MAPSRFRIPSQPGAASGGRTVFGLRPVAIGLMVAGVIGFIAARVLFGDQVLCLLGSTLVTFAGLAMIVAARKMGWGQPDGGRLRSTREQVPMPETPEIARLEQVTHQPEDALPPLAERTAAILRQQGAQISIETRHDDRSILQIATRDGERYMAMVLEEAAPVDTAEVRGLYALVASSRVDGGLLINGGGFTPRALQWAQGKPIRLVDSSRLSDLNI